VRVLTTDFRLPALPSDAPEDPDVHRELRWYWREHDWPRLSWRERFQIERHNARVFDRHIQEFRPDVLAWWPMGGMSLGLIERGGRTGVPAVLFVYDYWPRYGTERDLWLHGMRRLRGVRRVVEQLTGLPTQIRVAGGGRWLFSAECVREVTLESGWPITDSGLLPPGIEEAYLRAPREHALQPWQWRLLYLGRVVEQKGVHTAIQALPHLPAQATLRIVGDGDERYRADLQELAEGLGVGGRVEIEPKGPHGQALELYRSSDALLFPVIWREPWGLVPLEAMAAGTAVLATGRGGSGDYLRDAHNCLLFPPEDPEALARALRRLAADENLRRQLRQAGYETAAAHGEDDFNRHALEETSRAASRAPQAPR
jgi:glycogen synthase